MGGMEPTRTMMMGMESDMYENRFVRAVGCKFRDCPGVHCACGGCLMPSMDRRAFWCRNARCGNVIMVKELMEVAA